MADGVKIRIVGDDSEFVKTLEGLEKRAQAAFQGVRAAGSGLGLGAAGAALAQCAAQVTAMGTAFRGVNAQAEQLGGLAAQAGAQLKQGVLGLTGQLSYGISIDGDVDSLAGQLSGAADGLASGIRSRSGAVAAAAKNLAAVASRAMSDTSGAYSAGLQMGAGFQRGIAAKRAAVAGAAQALANAAAGALRSTLMINSPSRVTMKLGEYAGEGFEIGLTQSLQTAVRNAGNVVGAINLAPRMTAGAAGVTGAADAVSGLAAQPVYLNVDGRTLATVITDDMRTTMNRRSRSIGLGVGR